MARNIPLKTKKSRAEKARNIMLVHGTYERNKEIYKRYLAKGVTYQQLGDKYGLSRQAIQMILESMKFIDSHYGLFFTRNGKSLGGVSK